MRFSNALMLGVSILALTFCKRPDEIKPKESTPNAKVSAAAFSKFDHVISANEYQIDGKTRNIKPGDVIGLEAGTRARALLFTNIVGEAGKPIIIVNKGGKTTIKTSANYGIKFENSKHFRLTGSGDPKVTYGVEVDGGHISVTMDKLTTNFEVDHLEIHNSGFAGLMAKTDPSCDEATWRGNFTMRDLNIHHNYVHHTKGEGFYIGNSFYNNGRALSCGSIQPHSIENVKLHNNITEYTGCEGIQVGCVIKGAEIYNNKVSYFGQDPFAAAQNNGIQIGEGTGGKLYNNIVSNGPGNGLIILGLGDNVIYNNIVINPGTNGVFCDERYTPGPGFTFLNNTIINPGNDGMRLYSELVSFNKVVNNIIVVPGNGKFINTKSGLKLEESNNLMTRNINEVKFKAPSQNDFSLTASSPAIDKGMNVSGYNISYDFANASRPAGNGYDIGAYEFGGTKLPDEGENNNGGGNGNDNEGGGDNGGGNSGGGGDSGGGVDPSQPLSVTEFKLIDANTNKEIATLSDGHVVSIADMGTTKFNIKAVTQGQTGSVIFQHNGGNRTENTAPYALFGDNNGNYNAGNLRVGSHSLTGTPYSSTSGRGTRGTPKSITFTVVEKSSSTLSNAVFKVLEDAYIQNGQRVNGPEVMTDRNRKIAYLKFTIEGLQANKAQRAILQLVGSFNKGNGPVKIYLGTHNNWSENNLTTTNAPAKAAEIGSINTSMGSGPVYTVDITNAIKGDGTYTLILEKTAGMNDFSFRSKETGQGATLTIN